MWMNTATPQTSLTLCDCAVREATLGDGALERLFSSLIHPLFVSRLHFCRR